MPSFKKYVPRFGSESDSSQRNVSHPDHRTAGWPEASSHFPRETLHQLEVTRTPATLKVRLAKFTGRTALDRGATQEPPASNTIRSREPEGETPNDKTGSPPVDQSIFFFSQDSSFKVKNEKEVTKLVVLRTIARMLEENELIRQRLALLTQAD